MVIIMSNQKELELEITWIPEMQPELIHFVNEYSRLENWLQTETTSK